MDLDPWLVEMGRRTVGREFPGRVEWREADLRRDDWMADLDPGSFDAVLTATALHWFQPEDLADLYRQLAGLLAEGGLFLNADHYPVGVATLDGLARGAQQAIQAANFARPGAEDWAAYWDAASATARRWCTRASPTTTRRCARSASARPPSCGGVTRTRSWWRCAERGL